MWSTGKRLLMCSRVRAWLTGRPRPPSPGPHVGKRRRMLGGAQGMFKGMLRGCLGGDAQGVLKECPGGCPGGCGASSSPTPSSGAEGPLAWGPLAATGPQGLASAPRRGQGGKEGPCSPRAHPEPRKGLCAAVQQLQPRSLPGRWHRGCPPSPSARSKPGCGASEWDEPPGGAANPPQSCWGWSPWGWDPQEQRAVGWACTPALGAAVGTLNPCQGGEAPVPPPGVMSRAGIPEPGRGGTLDTQVLAEPGRHRRLSG